jgi:cupin 2 domain-containing protein
MHLFSAQQPPKGQEVSALLFEKGPIRVERIVSNGYASPPGFWYDQAEDELVFVLQGEGVIAFPDGTEKTLRQGDSLYLPAGQKHRVVRTSVTPCCLWLCLFFPATDSSC